METRETILFHLKHLKQLVFEVTDSCNLNCGYCGLSHLYEGNDDRNRKNLSFAKAKTIIDYLYSLRNFTPGTNYPLTISFYGGEPLLNMILVEEIIAYSRNLFPFKVNFSMTTNAVLLDRYMDFLVENEINLLISLDGNEANQSYRVDWSGKNSFHRVFNNIKLLQRKHPEYFERFVLFNSVLHNRNDVETTYRFIKTHFDKIPMLSPLNTVGIKEEKILEFNGMYRNVNENIIHSTNCESLESEMFIRTPRIFHLSQYIFRNSGNSYNDFNDLIFDMSELNTNNTGTCTPFSKKMFVTVDGKILQCERISNNYKLGQINEDNIDLDLEDIANKQNQYVSKINHQCVKCFLNTECPQCVFNIENIIREKPACSSYISKRKYTQLKKMTTDYLREHPTYYERILKEVTFKY